MNTDDGDNGDCDRVYSTVSYTRHCTLYHVAYLRLYSVQYTHQKQ